MQFRKSINALRALAVLSVVLFHFKVPGFEGGFAGVDVFFVISGFLMTGIIVNGVQQQNFSLLGFYASRARRIIPALLVLCVTLLVFGYLYLPLDDLRETIRTIKSSLLFSSNFSFAESGNYFAAPLHENWLLHTWSLSVEWQFYLLYPVLIMGLHKCFGADKTRFALVALALMSLAASIIVTRVNPTFAFYMLPTRAWEMIAGGLVFLFPLRLSPRGGAICESLGLLAIAVSVLGFSEADLWPGYLALLPVLGDDAGDSRQYPVGVQQQFCAAICREYFLLGVSVALAAGGAAVLVRAVDQLATCDRRDHRLVHARHPVLLPGGIEGEERYDRHTHSHQIRVADGGCGCRVGSHVVAGQAASRLAPGAGRTRSAGIHQQTVSAGMLPQRLCSGGLQTRHRRGVGDSVWRQPRAIDCSSGADR
ncbi:acyltransferase [Pseudomonas sp. MD195_PC81_125]|uniref:acyltransferase family protein n=1 Tax=Pseudomonas sp. MD195_PC81_125 TaxID=2741560 RepID=UPI0027408926|nr:acyltransferase [Pseudomonas sp. MD195_PC81_125]